MSLLRRNRSKSDAGFAKGSQALNESLDQYAMTGDTIGNLPDFTQQNTNKINRRMSTPHPIKARPAEQRQPSTTTNATTTRTLQRNISTNLKPHFLYRSNSAPDLSSRYKKTMNRTISQRSMQSAFPAGDLAVPASSCSDGEPCPYRGSDFLSESSSLNSCDKQSVLDEIFDSHTAVLAEALWDHVTLDPEELAFEAGDVIQVTDVNDKNWWYGSCGEKKGWFPSTFVRLRILNDEVEGNIQSQSAVCATTPRQSCALSPPTVHQPAAKLMNKEQARSNVVNEIIHAERDYVKHLKNVVEGFLHKAMLRPEMFSKECLKKIFVNIEELYGFSSKFLQALEAQYNESSPHSSELGCSFLKHRCGFEVYSEFCNNHQEAMEHLHSIQSDEKYQQFFEACRLLQSMIKLPLDGFLLTPVQKICKYRLQLAELLKYTSEDHPDYRPLESAIYAMREIALTINERKRRIESLAQLVTWQQRVQDWEGPPLVQKSSQLIFSGDLIKINSSGWSQERRFFLFDHQLVYCKKDLLWRDVMLYKGRMDLNHCQIFSINDGRKDGQFGVTTKYGFKIYDKSRDKWYLIHGKTSAEKQKWIKAFEQETKMRRETQSDDLKSYRKRLCNYEENINDTDRNGNQLPSPVSTTITGVAKRSSQYPPASVRGLSHMEHTKPHRKRNGWNFFSKNRRSDKT